MIVEMVEGFWEEARLTTDSDGEVKRCFWMQSYPYRQE